MEQGKQEDHYELLPICRNFSKTQWNASEKNDDLLKTLYLSLNHLFRL